jgi:hypothetical protein
MEIFDDFQLLVEWTVGDEGGLFGHPMICGFQILVKGCKVSLTQVRCIKLDAFEVKLTDLKVRGRRIVETLCWLTSFYFICRDMESEDVAPRMTDLEIVKKGPEGVPEDVLPVLLLFCAAYSHLLVVLDDEEFYDHQVVRC